MRIRLRYWLLTFTILIIANVISILVWAVNRIEQSLHGPLHEFRLTTTPEFLTEELAVSKAWEVLAKDYLDGSAFQIRANSITKSPDGNVDKYLVRNEVNYNRGVMTFTGPSGSIYFVSVELQSDKLVCQSDKGK